MQKIRKILNTKENLKISKKNLRTSKNKLRIRRIFKNKSYTANSSFKILNNSKFESIFYKKLNIRVTPNNIFCTLKNISTNEIINVGSAGKYKIKTSKKTLRYSSKIIVEHFLEETKDEMKNRNIIINIIGPIRIRKAILKQLSKYISNCATLVNVDNKKCFNGCRPPKKRRKKQKGLRIFK